MCEDFLSGQEGAWPTSLGRPLRKSTIPQSGIYAQIAKAIRRMPKVRAFFRSCTSSLIVLDNRTQFCCMCRRRRHVGKCERRVQKEGTEYGDGWKRRNTKCDFRLSGGGGGEGVGAPWERAYQRHFSGALAGKRKRAPLYSPADKPQGVSGFRSADAEYKRGHGLYERAHRGAGRGRAQGSAESRTGKRRGTLLQRLRRRRLENVSLRGGVGQSREGGKSGGFLSERKGFRSFPDVAGRISHGEAGRDSSGLS